MKIQMYEDENENMNAPEVIDEYFLKDFEILTRKRFYINFLKLYLNQMKCFI